MMLLQRWLTHRRICNVILLRIKVSLTQNSNSFKNNSLINSLITGLVSMNLCHERVQRGPCQTSMMEFCAKKQFTALSYYFFKTFHYRSFSKSKIYFWFPLHQSSSNRQNKLTLKFIKTSCEASKINPF